MCGRDFGNCRRVRRTYVHCRAPHRSAHRRNARTAASAERGRQYFVVDASAQLLMLPSRASRVLMLRDSCVAVAVDSIDRIAEISAIHPLPHAFLGEERGWYRGVALIQDAVIPVVNAESFLSASDIKQLQAAVSKSAQSAKHAAGAVSA